VDVNGRSVSVSLGPEGISVDGDPIEARIEEVDGTPIVLLIAGGTLHRLAVRRGDGRGRYSIWSESHRFEVEALDERRRAIRDMAGASAENAGPAPLVAPMPGLVVRINVEAGDPIRAGQPLVVMEAMKMENELRSTSDGVVRAIRVRPGEAVEKGTVLIELAES
jgi:acetyl/propionyl-CoA carboxylase alpha subunit